MAESFRGWLKTILYADVLLCICSMLLEKTKYEKYMRFLSGFLILTCLIQPLLALSDVQSYLYAAWLMSSMKSELAVIRDSDSYEELEEGLLNDYEAALKKQIVRIGDHCHIQIDEIEISWDSAEKKITALSITGQRADNEETIPDILKLQESLAQLYQLEQENIKLDLEL